MRKEEALRLSLRIVFYREDGIWIAHCLETDLVGVGATKQEAMDSLWDATAVQLEASLDWDAPANFFSPAEGRYFEMYARGRDVATAETAIRPGRLGKFRGGIDDVTGRECMDLAEPASL